MSQSAISPKKSLNKAFLKIKLNRDQINIFKSNMQKLTKLSLEKESESEEFHKNVLSDFLKSTYYQDNFFINTSGRVDLVIHNSKHVDSSIGVLVESKRPGNSSEMPKPENLNTKALQELLLYYLRERFVRKNLEIKHLVITNNLEWFIFDSNIFEKLCSKALLEKFHDFESGRLSGKTTDFFYLEIAKPFLEEHIDELTFTYFNLQDYETVLDSEDDTRLIPLYKILSPEHLLKLPFINDSNNLDKCFYTELLHIIGLREIKDKNKKIISRKVEGERSPGTLLENAIEQLDSHDKINRLPNPSEYGQTYKERLFHVALELCIVWINRILFLKLLESQLTTYHKGDKDYSFLNLEKINSFDDLDRLFFQVLAKKISDRNEKVKSLFEKVPYLNSSLFEPSDIEHSTIFIGNLNDDDLIPILSSTVLKDKFGKRRSGSLKPLEYIFAFLDSYDFSSEGNEEIIQDVGKSLINASVLGLIFEKINGYKDGSFFTPGFITMYMCRETIRNAVLQKFHDVLGWDCKDFSELYNKIDDIAEANKIINSLKICDPAVGSGHFLVSALNEIIAIKSELGILVDKDGKRLKNYHIEVVNDELIVTDEDEEYFLYNPKNKESRRVQETLFHEKQTIIENCLFGVDINPNSVKICRLRLWIELLKNAYYTEISSFSELETLPNIDINIKCGNSLISRFPLDVDIREMLKNKRWTIEEYKQVVHSYQNAKTKEEKRGFEVLIHDIKKEFKVEMDKLDPKKRRLSKLSNELDGLVNQQEMFELSKTQVKEREANIKKLKSAIFKLETELNDMESSQIYENAFEWRFEFPEVLNDEGDFVGFDVVIGNPPYGVSVKGKEREIMVSFLGKVPDYEIYYWFINLGRFILREMGIVSLIIPNSILFNVFAQNYRLNLLKSFNINSILDCTSFDVFIDATVRNIIFSFTKANKLHNKICYRNTKDVETFEELIRNPLIETRKDILVSNNLNWGIVFKLDNKVLSLIQKIKENSINLKSIFPYTSQGLIAYDKYRGQDKETIEKRIYHSFEKKDENYKPWLYGEDITKYHVKWNEKEFINYCAGIANPREPKFFKGNRILVREITNPSIFAGYTEEELYNDPSILIVLDSKNPSFSLYALLGILNSKLASFYHFNSSPKATKGAFPKILVYDINNFPLPKSQSSLSTIENLVNQILSAKKSDPNVDTSELEKQIDKKVYELYDLTEEEIQIIEKE